MKSIFYVITWLCLIYISGYQAPARAEDTGCFSYVKQLAEQRSGQAFVKTPMMQVDTGRITYDHYQHIKFRHNKTFWRAENLPFQIEFMHPGMHYIQPIELFTWENGQAQPIKFSKDYYDYSEVKFLNLENDEPRMGFTGFRILSKLGGEYAAFSETMVFQGASYFRALAQDQHYGLSARGLGINTSLEGKEEFPDYTQFWLEKPKADAKTFTFCALLDSPSTTGASRFVLTPGSHTDVEVETQLYPRQDMTQIAVAPLTSMFFHGENSTQRYGDYRPEVHDSDGLLVQQAEQGWLWQPLAEVPYFNVGAIPSKQLKGFGLMQRDRDFNNYQDLEAWYHARPSVWVEPLEDWGSGQVKLMRLHTESDTTDNIVAFWQSDAGMQFKHLHYRVSWRSTDPDAHKLGKVVATRVTNKAVDSMPGHNNRIRFIIDFNQLPPLKEPPTAIITINGKAQAKPAVVQENPYVKGWRVIAVVFPDSCAEPINLSVQLTNGGNPLTETWSYPVPQDLCIAP